MSYRDMMNPKKLLQIFMTFSAIIVFVVGCGLADNTPTPSSLPGKTQNWVPTKMQLSPSPTISETPFTKPAEIVLTPTSTNAPIPTLNSVEQENFTKNLIKTNADCLLPCWWGILPGKTTWNEAENLFTFLGIKTGIFPTESRPLLHATSGFDYFEQQNYNDVSIFESQDIVVSLEISSDGLYNPTAFQDIWSSYAPEKLMPIYGVPSRVWLYSISNVHEGEPGNWMPYEIWIFYDHLGILLRYNGRVDYQEKYLMCPTFEGDGNLGFGLDIFLQSPESSIRLENLTDVGYYGSKPLSLEEATGMNINDFQALYSGKYPCFETSREIWP